MYSADSVVTVARGTALLIIIVVTISPNVSIHGPLWAERIDNGPCIFGVYLLVRGDLLDLLSTHLQKPLNLRKSERELAASGWKEREREG